MELTDLSNGSVLPSPALTNDLSPSISVRHASPSALVNEAHGFNKEIPVRNGPTLPPIANDFGDNQQIANARPIYAHNEKTSQASAVASVPPILPPIVELRSSSAGSGQISPTLQTSPSDVPQRGQISSAQHKRSRVPEGSGSDSIELQQWKRARISQSTGTTHPPPTQGFDAHLRAGAEAVAVRVRYTGGWNKLSPGLEYPRYRYLSEACNKHDWLYVSVHQFFCLWSLDPECVARLLSMEPDVVNRAFAILLQVLKSNGAMKLAHLNWFAEFPLPVKGGLPQTYNAVVPGLRNFISAFALHWQRQLSESLSRGIPVTALEMVNILACPSEMLQQVLYTVSRRAGSIPDRFASELNELFRQEQASELMISRGLVADPAMERQETTSRYMSLARAARVQHGMLTSLFRGCIITTDSVH